MTLFDAGGRSKLKLVVAYDGTDFHGFAAQPDQRTVAGVMARALEKVLRHPIELTCSGRTDSGVHAWGQVVSLEADPGVDPWRLRSSLNGILGPEVVVRSCELVPADFDARFSAVSRSYRYTIVNRPEPDPFLARFAWWVPEPLDIAALRLGADPFLGEHDFSAFCRKGPEGSTNVRRVLRSQWLVEPQTPGVLRYEITARAFCWQMVRSIVGTLVEVGRGKRRPGDLRAIMRSGDRNQSGQMAPAQGLCLWDVGF